MKKISYLPFLFSLLLFPLFADENEEFIVTESPPAEEKILAAVDNLGPNASGYSSEGEFGPEDEDTVDPKVLRDFIESRGLIECRQKCGRLTIAGDVRARWTATGEQVNGFKKRGAGTETAINLFKSEFNLFLDYTTPCSWASVKLRWNNYDGKDGGSATRTELDRAFIGYDVYNCKDEDFYIEVGRSKLDYIFDSRVQFTSVFDGIHLYYTNYWPKIGTVIVHGGPFIIDSFTNHYGWIVETGINEWAGTGFSFKYSIIDWSREAPTLYYGNLKDVPKSFRLLDNPRYRFLISQMLFGYERKINFLGCKTFFAYGAVLVNHNARATPTTDGKLLNGAWYAGFTLGKLCKAYDWSIDINYQSVQAQAVPEFDLAGIGHGNADNTLLSDFIILGSPAFVTRGFTNYKGWQISLLYALTDTLTIRTKTEWSTPRNKSVGGDFFYKNFEMSVIYAF